MIRPLQAVNARPSPDGRDPGDRCSPADLSRQRPPAEPRRPGRTLASCTSTASTRGSLVVSVAVLVSRFVSVSGAVRGVARHPWIHLAPAAPPHADPPSGRQLPVLVRRRGPSGSTYSGTAPGWFTDPFVRARAALLVGLGLDRARIQDAGVDRQSTRLPHLVATPRADGSVASRKTLSPISQASEHQGDDDDDLVGVVGDPGPQRVRRAWVPPVATRRRTPRPDRCRWTAGRRDQRDACWRH